MIDNPNRSSNGTNFRRRKSLETLSKLRRRATMLTTTVTSSSHSTRCSNKSGKTNPTPTIRIQPPMVVQSTLQIPSFGGVVALPSKPVFVEVPSSFRMDPIAPPSPTIQNPQQQQQQQQHNTGIYSLRIVSSKLNKTNPYVGSFRHAPPTTIRDLRIEATPYYYCYAPPFGTTSTSHKDRQQPIGATPTVNFFRIPGSRCNGNKSGVGASLRTPTTTPSYHFRQPDSSSLSRSLIDSYKDIYITPFIVSSGTSGPSPVSKSGSTSSSPGSGSNRNSTGLSINVTSLGDSIRTVHGTNHLDNTNDFFTQDIHPQLLRLYQNQNKLRRNVKREMNGEEEVETNVNGKCVSPLLVPVEKDICTEPFFYLSKHNEFTAVRKRHRSTSCSDNSDDLCLYISGHLRGGSPSSVKTSSTTTTTTSKIVNGIASWLLQLDYSVPFTSDEHTVVPRPATNTNNTTSTTTTTRRQDAVDRNFTDSIEEASQCNSSVSSDTSNQLGEDDQSVSSSLDSSDASSYDNYDTAHGSRIVTSDHQVTLVPQELVIHSSTDCPDETQTLLHHGIVRVDERHTLSISEVSENLPLGRFDYDTITQMDIIRMTRIASRHLDVASIYQLPIMTYVDPSSSESQMPNRNLVKNEKSQKDSSKSEDIYDRNITESHSITSLDVLSPSGQGITPSASIPPVASTPRPVQKHEFSWMMVDTALNANVSSGGSVGEVTSLPSCNDDEDSSTCQLQHLITITRTCPSTTTSQIISPEPTTDVDVHEVMQQQQVCVICLEQFVHGDRLRVLPCTHSFHFGCIAKWLSGTHSDEDCYTAGCPTCKKHPANDASTLLLQLDICQSIHEVESSHGCSSSCSTTSSSSINKSQTILHGCTPIHSNTHRDGRNDDDDTGGPCDYMHESIDGSVPPWAFAHIGAALARDSSYL